MSQGRIATGIAGTIAALVMAAAAQAEPNRLSVLAGGEIVGEAAISTHGDRVEIDYRVSNNGRGPKVKEEVTLGPDGLPVEWTVRGTSTFGSEIDEAFAWRDGIATWRSQADEGRVRAASAPLYVVNDGSPWALELYVRKLLEDPDRRIDVLPGGALRLEALGDEVLGEGEQAVTGSVYRLNGLILDPAFVMLDAEGRLFAEFTAKSVTVRAGYERHEATLKQLAADLETERVRELQQALAHRFDRPVQFRNVRVFDPVAARTGPPVSVVVYDDEVVMVSPDADPIPGAVVVDGEGGTLVPGLHDMHSHSGLTTGLYYLAAGVTSVRDMGNDNDVLLPLKRRIDSGELPGPRIVPAGFIEGRSPHSARNGVIPETVEEALEAVRWYARHGYRQVKLYNSMNPEWVPAIAAEAHRLGLGVSGHVPAFTSPDEMILAGYDDIAHINQLMLGWLIEPGEDTRTPLRLTAMARAAGLDLDGAKVRRTVELMREHGVAQDTTAVILERLMLSRAREIPPGAVDYLEHLPIGYQRYRKRTYVPLEAEGQDAEYRKAFETLLGTLRLLHESGIRLLPGTDDRTGFTVHRELELYVMAGIPAGEALRLATLGCETYFGRDHLLGTIERGKLADFFLVEGDPAADIRAIKRIRMVVKGGTIYYPSEIYRALDIEPFAAPPPVTVPEDARAAAGG